MVLESINRWLSRDAGAYDVLDGAPTVEHIMPQSHAAAWQTMLADEWAEVYQQRLHTLGNLTLVTQPWNSSLSDKPWIEKRSQLATSGLRLNRDYFTQEIAAWDADAISARADWIVDSILAIWPALGTPTVTGVAGVRPMSVTILGSRYPETTWREVMFRTAAVLAEWLGEEGFAALAQKYPMNFSRKQFKYRPKQLSNGWWVYLNLSRVGVETWSRRMLETAKIPAEEWSVEEVTQAD